jgi:hypothetical protein
MIFHKVFKAQKADSTKMTDNWLGEAPKRVYNAFLNTETKILTITGNKFNLLLYGVAHYFSHHLLSEAGRERV